MAGADIFEARITGKGGHGALPHEAVDPLLAAAQIVISLQSIVARNVSPLDTAVVSVCRLHAGDAFNVIPQTADIGGTFRTYDPVVRQKIIDRFQALVQGVAEAHGCRADISVQRLTPAVVNDPEIAERVRNAVSRLAGLQVVHDFRTMVSEDMAYLMERAPGCYIMVGSANQEKGLAYGHHHPMFDFDEDALGHAVAVMTAAVLELLR
jgi:amidohydrolase